MKKIIAIIVFSCLLVSCTTTQTKKAALEPTMTAEQMMAKWGELNAVNENHEKLKALAGQWETEVTCWMMDQDKPVTSKGSSDNKIIMDGRFIKEKFEGFFHGQPFYGLGLTGYDNTKGKFVSVWIDSTTTGIMQSEGVWSGNTLTWNGEYLDPFTKETKKSKSVLTFINDKEHKFEMWDLDPQGKEFKAMEIKYTKSCSGCKKCTKCHKGKKDCSKKKCHSKSEKKDS